MKKCIALLLCGVLSMSLLTGCGGGEDKDSNTQKVENNDPGDDNPGDGQEGGEQGSGETSSYDETIPFTYTSYYSVYQMNSGVDYESDPLYQHILDRFNIEPEMWACEDSGANDKIQTWVNTETMPDCMWNCYFGLDSYFDYVDQGLLQALPDGWETRWPNIAYMTEASGMADILKIDGKTYAIPHAVSGLYTESKGGALIADTVFFRKDLAKQVGMDDFGKDNKATISEFKEYLEKVKENQLVPVMLEGGDFFIQRGFCNLYGLPETGTVIIETENGFEFTPATKSDTYKEMMTELQEWYKEGLIDPDYFTKTSQDSINSFTSGQAAGMYYASVAADNARIRGMYEGATGKDGVEDVGVVIITADDGTLPSVSVDYNYWTCTSFSPNTDEKTLERILDFTDWLCSKEGDTSLSAGIPGVDWDYDEDGNPYRLKEDTEGRNVEFSPFANLGWCMDDIAYTGLNATIGEQDIMDAQGITSIGWSATNLYRVSDNYRSYRSETKSNYSFPITEKIKEIICGNMDVGSTWDEHVDEYSNLWEPLINELNEAYGY